MAGNRHIPVLLREVLDVLINNNQHSKAATRRPRVFLDATFGYGGYSRAILNMIDDSVVVAIDRDPVAIERAHQLICEHPHYRDRLIPVHARFSTARQFIPRLTDRSIGANSQDIMAVGFDGIAMDLGVSSMQLDDPKRGFSYQSDGPLDMRMSAGSGEVANSPTASDLVNTLPEYELERILREYGEERMSAPLASAILRRRLVKPLLSTADLAAVVACTLRSRCKHSSGHPAARTFQALRIAVNDEVNCYFNVSFIRFKCS
jgi:16S rRNA (cytosine1402-N4)-methyltransferase